MNARFILSALLLALISLPGCGGKDDGHKDHTHKDDGHKDHDHKDDGHKDHDHKDEGHKDDAHAESDSKVLGKSDIAGYSVEVKRYGEVKEGGEVVLDVTLTGGTGEPQAVRAWVGVESGDGSLKGKLDKEGGKYHGHVEAPKPLPADSAIWVEIQDAAGVKASGKFAK